MPARRFGAEEVAVQASRDGAGVAPLGEHVEVIRRRDGGAQELDPADSQRARSLDPAPGRDRHQPLVVVDGDDVQAALTVAEALRPELQSSRTTGTRSPARRPRGARARAPASVPSCSTRSISRSSSGSGCTQFPVTRDGSRRSSQDPRAAPVQAEQEVLDRVAQRRGAQVTRAPPPPPQGGVGDVQRGPAVRLAGAEGDAEGDRMALADLHPVRRVDRNVHAHARLQLEDARLGRERIR